MFKKLIFKIKHRRFCKLNNYNCSECIHHNFIYDSDGIIFKGNACMYGRKASKNSLLDDYPCDVYLHNALRFISENKSSAAYDEICNAIIRSGGELFDSEKNK